MNGQCAGIREQARERALAEYGDLSRRELRRTEDLLLRAASEQVGRADREVLDGELAAVAELLG